MSSDVQSRIINMIKNRPFIAKDQLNCRSVEEDRLISDSVYDFITERVDEENMLHFKDIGSIVKWLSDGDGNYNGEKKTVTKLKRCAKSTFKPGQKIKIPKPKSTVRKFNNIQGALAVLKQNNNTNQSNSGDAEEIDVTTLDNHPSPWNTYAMAHQENRQHINVLTEIHPIATAPTQPHHHQQKQQRQSRNSVKHPKVSAKRKRSKSTDENKTERRFWCNLCEKKYLQNSSLLRHQRDNHGDRMPAKRPKNNQSPTTEL